MTGTDYNLLGGGVEWDGKTPQIDQVVLDGNGATYTISGSGFLFSIALAPEADVTRNATLRIDGDTQLDNVRLDGGFDAILPVTDDVNIGWFAYSGLLNFESSVEVENTSTADTDRINIQTAYTLD